MGKVQRAIALHRLKEEDVGIADIEKHLYTQVWPHILRMTYIAVPLGNALGDTTVYCP